MSRPFPRASLTKLPTDAAKFKSTDDEFSKRFEARQSLDAYVTYVQDDVLNNPLRSTNIKRGIRIKIEEALSEAMGLIEDEDQPADALRKKVLDIKRLVTKASSSR